MRHQIAGNYEHITRCPRGTPVARVLKRRSEPTPEPSCCSNVRPQPRPSLPFASGPAEAPHPYPDFYAALERFAERGASAVAPLVGRAPAGTLSNVTNYFAELRGVAALLREMAECQRSGTPFTEEHMTFINDTVGFFEGGCVPEGSSGWYARLFFDRGSSHAYDPVVADVHTQPTDEVGNEVGKVLHVGTGYARRRHRRHVFGTARLRWARVELPRNSSPTAFSASTTAIGERGCRMTRPPRRRG